MFGPGPRAVWESSAGEAVWVHPPDRKHGKGCWGGGGSDPPPRQGGPTAACRRPLLSLKTTLLLSLQMLARVERFHAKGFIHRARAGALQAWFPTGSVGFCSAGCLIEKEGGNVHCAFYAFCSFLQLVFFLQLFHSSFNFSPHSLTHPLGIVFGLCSC